MKRGAKLFFLSVMGFFVLCSGVCGIGGHIIGVALNGSDAVDVSRINNGWKANKNFLGDEGLDAEVYRDLLQQHCVPMGNGWRVLFNQAWYNMITEGYTETVWLESDETYGYYGLYIWEGHVLLRNGFGADNYRDRVLNCALPSDGWPS